MEQEAPHRAGREQPKEVEIMKPSFRQIGTGLLVAALILPISIAGNFSSTVEPNRVYAESGAGSPVGTNKIVNIARGANPAVVNVSTRAKVQPTRANPRGPMNPFMPQPFGQPDQSPERGGTGSGFIINEEGYILTNHHVVDGADQIKVTLGQGHQEREYPASLIGSDPKTDIALIHIERDKGDTQPLPHLNLGDSSQLEVGEWVVAIGNPFGLSHTVTTGIISAKGRSMGGPYDNYIQTDASINPGNSGGPLIDMKGDVVGINTAIISQSGGNVGIGFAIPSNLVKEIVAQLKDKGKVTRGWLGVMIQRVTPDLAESFKLKDAEGALVNEVAPRGPAEKGGILRGDVIVKFENRKISTIDELPRLVANVSPGTRVALEVIRDGQPTTVHVTIEELVPDSRA